MGYPPDAPGGPPDRDAHDRALGPDRRPTPCLRDHSCADDLRRPWVSPTRPVSRVPHGSANWITRAVRGSDPGAARCEPAEGGLAAGEPVAQGEHPNRAHDISRVAMRCAAAATERRTIRIITASPMR